jgi:hypothetical protein
MPHRQNTLGNGLNPVTDLDQQAFEIVQSLGPIQSIAKVQMILPHEEAEEVRGMVPLLLVGDPWTEHDRARMTDKMAPKRIRPLPREEEMPASLNERGQNQETLLITVAVDLDLPTQGDQNLSAHYLDTLRLDLVETGHKRILLHVLGQILSIQRLSSLQTVQNEASQQEPPHPELNLTLPRCFRPGRRRVPLITPFRVVNPTFSLPIQDMDRALEKTLCPEEILHLEPNRILSHRRPRGSAPQNERHLDMQVQPGLHPPVRLRWYINRKIPMRLLVA